MKYIVDITFHSIFTSEIIEKSEEMTSRNAALNTFTIYLNNPDCLHCTSYHEDPDEDEMKTVAYYRREE